MERLKKFFSMVGGANSWALALNSKNCCIWTDLLPKRVGALKMRASAHSRSSGLASGKLAEPTGIDIDPDGTVWVAYAWQGCYATALAAGDPVAYANPEEGRNSWVGLYGISADTDSYELALEFLDMKLAEASCGNAVTLFYYGCANGDVMAAIEDPVLIEAFGINDAGALATARPHPGGPAPGAGPLPSPAGRAARRAGRGGRLPAQRPPAGAAAEFFDGHAQLVHHVLHVMAGSEVGDAERQRHDARAEPRNVAPAWGAAEDGRTRRLRRQTRLTRPLTVPKMPRIRRPSPARLQHPRLPAPRRRADRR